MKLFKLTVSGAMVPHLFESWGDANASMTEAFIAASLVPGWSGVNDGRIEAVEVPAYRLAYLGDIGPGPAWGFNANYVNKGVYFGND